MSGTRTDTKQGWGTGILGVVPVRMGKTHFRKNRKKLFAKLLCGSQLQDSKGCGLYLLPIKWGLICAIRGLASPSGLEDTERNLGTILKIAHTQKWVSGGESYFWQRHSIIARIGAPGVPKCSFWQKYFGTEWSKGGRHHYSRPIIYLLTQPQLIFVQEIGKESMPSTSMQPAGIERNT